MFILRSKTRWFNRENAQENSLQKSKQGSMSRFGLSHDVCYSFTKQTLRYPRSSAFSSTTTTPRDTLDATTATGSTLSGQTATVLANRDITITGSNVVSDSGTLLVAKNNLTIEAATSTSVESHLKDEKKSGLFSGGGLSLTIGTQQRSADQKSTTTTAAASTIGSTQGNVNLSAEQAYQQVGSDVMAPAGDVNITAKKVDITEARETTNSQTETRFKQSGLTVAVTSPVISAIQSVQQMGQAAGNTSDACMQVLAAGNVAMAAKNAVDAIKGRRQNSEEIAR
jgi:filamentous hemagglutinin